MYKWIFLPGNKEQEEELIKDLNISPLLARLLVNRGITNKNLARKFLFSSLDDLYDSFYFFPKLEKALDYIVKLREFKKKILVYGDYDADGITSTVLLLKFLKKWGWDVDYYIPHRLYEGYGLKKDTLQKLDLSQYDLVITVDCGINSIEEVEFLRKNGVEVIITDHHIPLSQEIPNALLVLNPHLNNYPFPYLAGVGVAFKFLQTLSEKIGEKVLEEEGILELVSLGTLGDQVELKDENRILVKSGLERIPNTNYPGLKFLIRKAGLGNYSFLGEREILFYLVPRLNAIGRLREVKDAVELLLSEDEEKAESLAEVLDRENRERQRIKDEVSASVEELLPDYFEKEGEDIPLILLCNEEWHRGVLGLVASEVSEKYHRPVFLGKIEGEYIIFSGRGVEETNIFDFITKFSPYLVRYGGHKGAIGFSIRRDLWEEFYNLAIKTSKDLWKDLELIPKLKIDAKIDIKDINAKLFTDIEKLSPFGPGNEEPYFLISDSNIYELSEIKNGKFNIKIADVTGATLSVIGIGPLEGLTTPREEAIDMVVRVSKSNFGGENFYKIYLEDFKMKSRISSSSRKRKVKYLIHVENDIEKNSLLEKIKRKRKNITVITPLWNKEYWKDESLIFVSPWKIEEKIDVLKSSELIIWEDIELITKLKELIMLYDLLILEVKNPILLLTLTHSERTFLELSKILNIKVVKYPSQINIPSLTDLRFPKSREKEESFFKKISVHYYPSEFPFRIINHLVFYKPPLLISELRRWVKISKHSYLFFGKDEFMEGYKRIQEKSLELNPEEREFFRKYSQDFLLLLQKARLSELYSLLFQEMSF